MFLQGIDFSTFTMHMSIGVILVIIVVFAQLRFIFRDVTVLRFDEPQDVQVSISFNSYRDKNQAFSCT